MNKQMFWAGLSVFIVEVMGVILFLLASLNWDWITQELIINVIVFSVLALFNIFAFICMIVGVLSND